MNSNQDTVSMENKHVVVFWLKRHLRELESQTEAVSHTVLANAGISYAQRNSLVAQAEAKANALKVQIQSVRAAINYIEETVR